MNANIALLSDKSFHQLIISQLPIVKEVFCADTQADLVKLLESQKINMVICDSQLVTEDILNIKTHSIIILSSENQKYSLLSKNFTIIYKPFDINELLSQMKLIINEQKKLKNHLLIGKYKFDFSGRVIKKLGSEQVSLTEKESSLLKYLFEKKSYVSKDELLSNIWGYSNMSDTHTLETHIYRIRKKLADEDIIIAEDQGYRIGY